MLWTEVSKEEKRALREWAMCQTGVLRAYRNGEINGMEYRWYKYRLEDLLDNIKEYYDVRL
jgi:hypothetical protein